MASRRPRAKTPGAGSGKPTARGRSVKVKKATGKGARPVVAEPVVATSTVPVVDSEILAKLVDLGQRLGEDVLGQVMAIFRSKVPQQTSDLERAVATGDAAAAARLAHSIKGSAGNVGARALSDAAGAIEELSRGGEVERAKTRVDAVRRELDRALAALPA